jgi:hypothetical protein
MSDSISGPANTSDRGGSRLVSFFVKTVAVGAVATMALSYLVDKVTTAVDDMIDRRVAQLHGKFGGREFWTNFERSLHAAAAAKNELPSEQQQRLIEDIRIVAGRARPFALAAASALAADPPAKGAAKEK